MLELVADERACCELLATTLSNLQGVDPKALTATGEKLRSPHAPRSLSTTCLSVRLRHFRCLVTHNRD
jgi:hypothetical protein